MNRAALYIRVSTLEQAQEGYSVGEQKERLIAYCKAKDWLIADIYVDGGYTGSNLNRPGIQKLISETDKLMELYQHDDIPAELLGEKINRLYNERTALQDTLTPEVEQTAMPFDLVEELLSDAAQIWDFADEAQKRRIMQSLISRIVLTDDDVKIEWAF